MTAGAAAARVSGAAAAADLDLVAGLQEVVEGTPGPRVLVFAVLVRVLFGGGGGGADEGLLLQRGLPRAGRRA